MNREAFAKFQRKLFDETADLCSRKGADYSGAEDALANFKRNGCKLGVDPLIVLSVYMNKHLDAIETYIRGKVAGKVPQSSEPIRERVKDAINYLTFFLALESEHE